MNTNKLNFPAVILNLKPGDAAPFPIDPELSAIAVAYTNKQLIADAVLPRVPVGKLSFKYNEFPIGESFRSLRTEVGRKGTPKVIELSAKENTASCVNHAIDDVIPYDDIEDAPPNYSPVDHSVEYLTNLIHLRREIITASMVFNAANYHTSCKTTLTNEWDDTTNGTPLNDLLTALDAPVQRPNTLVIGQGGWRILRTAPEIVKAIHGTSGDKGAATRQQVADLLEVQNVLVGGAFYDTAKKGQTASLATAWGDDYCSLLYIDPLADTRGGITFGFTATKGSFDAGQKDDSDIGARGGKRVRVIDSRKELVIANRAGYLISNIKT